MKTRPRSGFQRAACLFVSASSALWTANAAAAAGGASPTPTSSATAAGATAEAEDTSTPEPTPNPHVVNPHGRQPSAQDLRAINAALVSGSPFKSSAHRRQANLVRSGRKFQPQSSAQRAKAIPRGTVAVLVTDGNNTPLAGKTVQLKVTRQSIATGDQLSEKTVTTNADGLARFEGLNNETSFLYEAVIEEAGASYPGGEFRLEQDFGHVVKLIVYPSTKNIEDAFIVSRALYAIEPRDKVFQIQCLLRIHNTNPKTWLPGGLNIQLPQDWRAFSPGTTSGDLRLKQEENRVVVDGSFTPGQHDFSFSFQLPNEQTETAHLVLPTTPHLVDARVFLTASQEMGLIVEGFETAETARGNDGRHALLSTKDFLENLKPPSPVIRASVSGMPTAGFGPFFAYGAAALIALIGLALSATREKEKASSVAAEDLENAKNMILGELMALEKSFKSEQIGPKTYSQTRTLLLDALARLEAA